MARSDPPRVGGKEVEVVAIVSRARTDQTMTESGSSHTAFSGQVQCVAGKKRWKNEPQTVFTTIFSRHGLFMRTNSE